MEKKHISAILGAKEIYNNVTIPVESNYWNTTLGLMGNSDQQRAERMHQ